jgi:hypothetical protein
MLGASTTFGVRQYPVGVDLALEVRHVCRARGTSWSRGEAAVVLGVHRVGRDAAPQRSLLRAQCHVSLAKQPSSRDTEPVTHVQQEA